MSIKCPGCSKDIQVGDSLIRTEVFLGYDQQNNPIFSYSYWHFSCFFKYMLKNVFINKALTTLSEFGINKKYSGAKDNSKSLAEFLSYLIMAYQSMKSDYDVEEACKTLKETANKLRAEGDKKGAEKIEKAMKGMCERFL
jgi:hypothetical protein